MHKIGIIDYGMGNLRSVQNALSYIGASAFISDDKSELEKADSLILPGVGAFPDAIERLKKLHFPQFISNEVNRKPLLGICLGMQLLFEFGYEFKKSAGLSLISGDVVRLAAGENNKTYKVPHIGYNALIISNPSPLLKGIDDGTCFYFVHSYMGVCKIPSQLLGYTEHGENVTAVVGEGNVYGTQFHPEKSGEPGLMLLENFKNLV